MKARGMSRGMLTLTSRADASTIKHLSTIRRPVLYLNSLDDPMTHANITPYQKHVARGHSSQ